jgi:hypothetical protein
LSLEPSSHQFDLILELLLLLLQVDVVVLQISELLRGGVVIRFDLLLERALGSLPLFARHALRVVLDVLSHLFLLLHVVIFCNLHSPFGS